MPVHLVWTLFSGFSYPVPLSLPFSALHCYLEPLPANILHREGKLNPCYLSDWLSQSLINSPEPELHEVSWGGVT